MATKNFAAYSEQAKLYLITFLVVEKSAENAYLIA
jgi:hypothetical protein